MEQQHPSSASQPEDKQEESIFDEELLNSEEYNKHVRHARNAIFVVAGVQVVFALIVSFAGPDDLFMFNMVFLLTIAAIFAGLGFWANKSPFPAILVALIFYVSLLILDAVVDPRSIIQGIILKAIIIVYLVKGLKNAREAQRLKEALGK